MCLLRTVSLRPRNPRPARAGLYLVLGLVVGWLWLWEIWLLYFGLGLVGQSVLIGIPSIVGAQLLLRPIGRFERFLVVALLGHRVPEPEPLRYDRSAGSRWSGLVNAGRRSAAVFRDGHSWRVLIWMLTRAVTGPLGFGLVACWVLLPVAALLAPVAVLVDTVSDAVSLGLPGRYWLLLSPLGLVAVPVLRWATDALIDVYGRLAEWALGPGRAEIAAAALARAAQAEEQVRIDQELHDSIGHMLSMIVVQAGAGAHVFDKDPDFARRALGTIEQRGRAALGELDRIITTMRDGDAVGAGGHAPLPDANSLPALIAGAREAGMKVAYRSQLGELSAPLGRGVYRIVQEALTNAAKHAPGTAVRVDIATGAEAVSVSVVSELRGAVPVSGHTSGRGLASIRDRATLLGGEASVGTTDHDEFAVNAVLPLAAQLPDGTQTRCRRTRRCACLGCTIRRSVLQ